MHAPRFACFLLLLLAGCITPPAVSGAGTSRIWLPMYPAGSEAVTVAADGGVSLRGVWVPAEDRAPVVVHLLGSGGSVSTEYAAALLARFRDRGFASLAVDYSGVGPSDGRRSPDHLRRDARAIFLEAVRRAGAPGRVLVRGTSIGTLAAASLLEEGARPAAVVLFSPVRGETVAPNWLAENWWGPFAFLVSHLAAPATDVNLVRALRGAGVPLLVVVPERDYLLPRAEAKLVSDAVSAAGGTFEVAPRTGHLGLAVRAFSDLHFEDALLSRLVPVVPPVDARLAAVRAAVPANAGLDAAQWTEVRELVSRRRLDPPALAAALVLEHESNDRLLGWLRRLRADGLPFEALRALVDFDDPAGPLDPRELRPMRTLLATSFSGRRPSPEAIVALARRKGLADQATYETAPPEGFEAFGAFAVTTVTVSRETALKGTEAPARLRLPPAESFRQAVRLLLKAAGIPERMREGLFVFEQKRWRPLDVSPAAATGEASEGSLSSRGAGRG